MRMPVPVDPKAFYESFFPEQFRLHREYFPRVPRTSPATFVVEGVGAWSIAIENDALVIVPEKVPGTRLQVVFSTADFESVVVARARKEILGTGRVSKSSLGPFVLLMSMDRKRHVLDGMQGSLLFRIQDGDVQRKMHIVPGDQTPPARARAVFDLNLKDTLALLNGEANGVALYMTRRMKIKGDLQFALKANQLLG
jgi:hypothetical protein